MTTMIPVRPVMRSSTRPDPWVLPTAPARLAITSAEAVGPNAAAAHVDAAHRGEGALDGIAVKVRPPSFASFTSIASVPLTRSGPGTPKVPARLNCPAAVSPVKPCSSCCWRLRLLSPTTEMDIGVAVYDTAYPRPLSAEYLAAALTVLVITLYGFGVLRAFCSTNWRVYQSALEPPWTLLHRLGSLGYDDVVDKQWTGFVIQFKRLGGVAVLLGAVTRLFHAVHTRLFPATASHCSAAVGTTAAASAHPAAIPLRTSAAPVSRDAATQREDPAAALRDLPSMSDPAVPRARRNTSSTRDACPRWTRLVTSPLVLPSFYSLVGLIFTIIVHGPHFFLPLAIIAANYAVFSRLQRWCPYWVFMAAMWTTHVVLLYVIELTGGFELAYYLQLYFPSTVASARRALGYAARPLWRQRMRWSVAFRMTTLRLIAFNYDLWEATHGAARARERAVEKHDTTCVECAQLREQNSAAAAALPAEAPRCYKFRTEHARDLADYGFVNYVAYVLFPPLYLAGPMSSFNAFVSYMRVPSTAMPPRAMARYAFSILRVFATEFILLHFVHITCLGANVFLLSQMSLLEQCHFLFFMLAYLWLKFSFIWKSSRLFAMFSGIEVPEDMRRCFANTLTVRDFWRDWHASFNLWIVRYMYIPLGGRGRVALSVLPIFLFIAVWHDPALHLIKWALCIALMFVAELLVSGCFGVVSRAFSREMAAASAAEGTVGTADGDAMDAGSADVAVAQKARRRRVWRRLARVCARRLSPRVRLWLHRQLRVVAGMTTVFGLTVANLVGFSMQNATATVAKRGTTREPVEAEDVIARSFAQFTPWFAAGLVMMMYAVASLAVIDRDLMRHQAASLKTMYELK